MDLECAARVVQRHFRALTCPLSTAFVAPGDRFRVVHNSNSSTLYSAKALYEYFDKYASDKSGQLQDPVVQRPYNQVEQKRLLDIIRKRPVRSQHRKRKLDEEMASMHEKIMNRSTNLHVRDSEDARRSAEQAERSLLIEESITSITFDVVTEVGRLKEDDIFMTLHPAEVSGILLPYVLCATESYLDCVVTYLAHDHPKDECLQMHRRCSDMIDNALQLLNLDTHIPSLSVWRAAVQFRQYGSPIIDKVREILNVLTLDMEDYMTLAEDRIAIVRGAGMLLPVSRGNMRVVLQRQRPPPPPLPEDS